MSLKGKAEARTEQRRSRLEQAREGQVGRRMACFLGLALSDMRLRRPSGDSRKGGRIVPGFTGGFRTRDLDLGVLGVDGGGC